MLRKFNRWIRSKQGLFTIGGVIAAFLVIALVGQLLGWWKIINLAGTAGVSPFPDPADGFSCLPTCSETDGRFISMPSANMDSFGGQKTTLWISVPADKTSFTVEFFDGDAGKNTNNVAGDPSNGHWDSTITETFYTLYADKLKDGTGTTQVTQWSSSDMLNNAWSKYDVNTSQDAAGPSGNFFYRLEATRSAAGAGIQGFKVRSSAYVSTGNSDKSGAAFGFIGRAASFNDLRVIYPEFQDTSHLGSTTTYDGNWTFYFQVPEDATSIEVWDGDFDRGTSATEAADDDDPTTSGVPSFADSAITLPETAYGKGNPADNSPSSLVKRGDPVTYQIIDSQGQPILTNETPSGSQEWENFIISTDPDALADMHVDKLVPGLYTLYIKGLDISNTVWFRLNYEMLPVCGTTPEACYTPPVDPPVPPEPPVCDAFGYNYAGGNAIVALNPAECKGEQNGLLFHGTSNTYIVGDAISNGCLRTVGTTKVEMTDGLVNWVGDSFKEENYGDFITPAPVHIDTPLTEWHIAKPNCDDPKAHHMDGKDFKGDVNLEPGLWCISGDVSINAQDTVTGMDVTLVMESGSWKTNGGAKVYLTAPFTTEDVSPAVNGVLFWAPGEKTVDGNKEVCNIGGACQPVTFNGNSQSYYQGVVYAPGSEIEVLGTGDVYAHRSQFIGWDVRVGGTAILKIDFRGNNLPVCEP